MKTEQLKQMIRESIVDQLAVIKEKQQNHKVAQAEALIKVLEEQASALKSLSEHAGKLFEDTQYSELTKEQQIIDKMYESKVAKIAQIREHFGIKEVKKKKPSSGLSKKKKSAIAKKAHKGGDIGKKGKNFDKVEKKAAAEYGSEEAGKKVAGAAMWKNAKR